MNLKIFFDESGKKSNPPMTMGAVSIPECIYQLDPIQLLNQNLKDKLVKFHFTKYNGNEHERTNIMTLLNIFKPYMKMCRGNVIYYIKPEKLNIRDFDKMVYSKFPERVFYGLLRGKGKLMNINAEIFMENATQYTNFPQQFKEQLNIQATYRCENFKIINCLMVAKNTEIGVEFTDLLLGIIRIIISKPSPNSNTYLAKADLVNNILAIPEYYTFFTTIKYYEWDYTQSLKEIKFKDYVDAYIAQNI